MVVVVVFEVVVVYAVFEESPVAFVGVVKEVAADFAWARWVAAGAFLAEVEGVAVAVSVVETEWAVDP